MNEKIYPRRGLIKRGLTLIGGVLVFGASRSSSAAAKTAASDKRLKKPNRESAVRQHCTEGESIGLPGQERGRNGG
jgi:uncharacterized protein (DUF3084 family)